MLEAIKTKIIQSKNQKELEHILENENFCRIDNKASEKIGRVFIVIRRMLPYSGGYTSILRLGTQLALKGYRVFYAVTSYYQTIQKAQRAALTNLKDYKGEFVKLGEIRAANNDILIATYWKTVYQIKNFPGYKMYFIQDYEPYFSQYGEEYLLAQKTYELGFHMVSLGQWNKYMIEQLHPGIHADYIDFPFEPAEYQYFERDYKAYKDKKEFKLAAFIKEDQKRIPNIVMSMLFHLEKEFATHGYRLDVQYFGISPKKKVKNGTNLGTLDKRQLMELYKTSDFGISASMTNVSLVPYEMLATGLPLIEFEDGTFPFFFPANSAMLTDFSYKHLYEKLMKAIHEPEILQSQHETANAYMKDLSWENTGKQFVKILESILEEE